MISLHARVVWTRCNSETNCKICNIVRMYGTKDAIEIGYKVTAYEVNLAIRLYESPQKKTLVGY